MKKKLILTLLMCSLSLSLFACGKTTDGNKVPEPDNQAYDDSISDEEPDVDEPAYPIYSVAYDKFIDEYVASFDEDGMETNFSYNLIYINDDDIPELVIDNQGFFVTTVTYNAATDKVEYIMDGWSYGAMGNVGYEYVYNENLISNINSDYAGLVRYFNLYSYDFDKNELEYTAPLGLSAWIVEDDDLDGMLTDEQLEDANKVETFENTWYYIHNENYGEDVPYALEITEEEFNEYYPYDEYEWHPICGTHSLKEIKDIIYAFG